MEQLRAAVKEQFRHYNEVMEAYNKTTKRESKGTELPADRP